MERQAGKTEEPKECIIYIMWLRVIQNQRIDDTEKTVTWQVEDGDARSASWGTERYVTSIKA
jgi:hypothetical protein